MTTTIELIKNCENASNNFIHADHFGCDLLKLAAQRLRELDKLVKAVHSAKGRHHNQIAMCDLYEACGLPFQRPKNDVKEST